jgi:hypothetical protein
MVIPAGTIGQAESGDHGVRIQTETWSVVIPNGWAAVIDGDQASMRFAYNAEVHHQDGQTIVKPRGGDLFFRLLSLAPGESVGSHAEAIMKRHVVQGEPERYTQPVGGRSAFGYSWTDGVQNIKTCFVESTPGALLRIDMATHGLGAYVDIAAHASRAIATIIESFEWVGDFPAQ